MFLAQKALADGVVEEGDQGVVVTVHVQQGAGFVVKTQLRPGEDFKNFFQGAHAAGQSDKAVRAICHGRLALMHGTDYTQFGEMVVADFLAH